MHRVRADGFGTGTEGATRREARDTMSSARSSIRVRVTFAMEVESTPWGDDAQLGQMRRDVKRAAGEAAQRLIATAAKEGVRLSVQGIDDERVILGGGA